MEHDVIARGRARRARLLGAIALAVGVLWCGGTAAADPPATQYYLAVGDSLAQGFQPIGGPTDGVLADPGYNQGYTNELFKTVRGATPGELRLVDLGCKGESTTSMTAGGRCPYAAGSQLAQAVAFLDANAGKVAFITIDLGANDLFFDCAFDPVCAVRQVSTNLPRILATLQMHAPGVPIVGMTYYAPFNVTWFQNPQAGQASAVQTAQFNAILTALYASRGVPVADVGGAFAITDFTTMKDLPGVGPVPLSVYNTCTLTWNCTPAPLGPNIHPNNSGYELIAKTFAGVVNGLWPR
jgi:lysophospholipase L1-like esterase